MADDQPFAQPVHERIEIEPAIERAKGRGTNMRAGTSLGDRMTLRAHSFGKSSTAPLQIDRRVLLGATGRYSEQRNHEREPYHHVENPPMFASALPTQNSRCTEHTGSVAAQPGRLEQSFHALARMEHACLYRVCRHSHDLGDFFHRLFVVVDEIDHFSMEC
jgi:hypothetical protein